MTVLVCNDTPPAIRGVLKRWFIEPKPNIFVGSVNKKTREKTIDFILRNAPEIGVLIIASTNNSQGFLIMSFGDTTRRPVLHSGHYLIAEKWKPSEKC